MQINGGVINGIGLNEPQAQAVVAVPGLMNNSVIASHVRQHLLDVSGKRYSDAVLLPRINQAQWDVARRVRIAVPKSTNLNLVQSQREYVMPSDFIKMKMVLCKLDANSSEIQLTERPLRDTFPSTTTLGTPKYWTRWGNTLRLNSAPSQSVTNGLILYYYGLPSQLAGLGVNDTQSELADKYRVAIVYRASMIMLLVDEEPQKASEMNLLFEQEIDSILKEEEMSSFVDQGKIIDSYDPVGQDFLNIS